VDVTRDEAVDVVLAGNRPKEARSGSFQCLPKKREADVDEEIGTAA
jgi:hypothetical protein